MNLTWNWAAFIMLLICSLGTILPLLPGLPLMALIFLGYGWFEGFQNINFLIIAIAFIFAIIGTLLDYFAGSYAAKKKGGTKGGYWGALLGGIFGIIFLGPIGLLLGPFLGALCGEFLAGKSIKEATQIGISSLWGLIIGNIFKFVLALTLSVIFFFRVFL